MAVLIEGDLGAVVTRILRAAPRRGRWLVAIDGVGASGKTAFTSAVALHIDTRPVVVLHADDFFNPGEIRHSRERYSPDGFWLDTYNYDALTSWALVRPEPVRAPDDAVVLVQGAFLHRDELAGYWDDSSSSMCPSK